MKIASLLIPTYMPSAYPSATPVAYSSQTIDKFERELAALSPTKEIIRRTFGITRLLADVSARFAVAQPITQYDVPADTAFATLGDAIALALNTFNLESITVIFDGDAEPINAGAVEELQTGLHPWSAEA